LVILVVEEHGGNPNTSRIDRIDYSNDLATLASIKNNLSSGAGARRGVSASGNSNFGYFSGGGFPATSTVDRIDYSNDIAAILP
jgi:hypothetical protein